MSTTVIKEKEISFIEQRKARVAEITKKHSQALFGYPHASIGEIRTEAVKRKLELIFNN